MWLPHHHLYYFTDRCGYVRRLLGVEGAIFNIIPIAQLLGMPEKSMNEVANCWKDEDEQIELILQHWSNDVEEDLAALRKDLERLQQKRKFSQAFVLCICFLLWRDGQVI